MRKDSRIPVLVVVTRMAVGGAPRHVLTLLGGLDRARYRVALATGVPEPDEGSLEPEADRLGLEVHRIPCLRREIRPLDDLRALAALCRLIRAGRFDIVHTHLSKAGILGRLAARLAGARAVAHTYHGDVFDGYFGRLKSRVLLTVERLAGAGTHRLIAVSGPLRRRLLGYGIGRPSRFTVVANGVDASAFRPLAGQKRPGPLRVGTAAMFYPIKRVDLFVAAAARLLERRRNLRFEIAGGGPMAGALKAAAAPAGDGIRFLGVRDDVPALLAAWDIFVLCSDYEGAGVSLVEAMLTGLPAVATRVGGVPEIVADGQTGILVRPGDADAVAQAVERLAEDEAMRRRMGAAGRARACRLFSADAMVAQLAAIYDGLSGRGPS